MPDENDIGKLLRLKRHEQPPPEYFEQFLKDFQQRQRADLLREPLWRIALNRVEALFSEPAMGRLGYAGATAAVLLVAGIASMKIVNSGSPEPSAQFASAASVTPAASVATAPQLIAQTQRTMTLDPRIRLADWNTFPSQAVNPGGQPAPLRPHYVIDARPASYEPPSSF